MNSIRLLEVIVPGLRVHVAEPEKAWPQLERPPRFRVDGAGHSPIVHPQDRLPVLFTERRYQLTVERLGNGRCRGEPELRTTDNDLFKNRVRPSPRYPLWTYDLNVQGYVGDLAFDVYIEKRRALSLQVEVFPTKLSYVEDYRALLRCIAEHERTLPFRMVAPTTSPHAFGSRVGSSLVEWLAVLRWAQRDLARAATRILAHPHEELRREAVVRPAGLVRRASARATSWLARHPQHVRADGPPERLIDERRILTHDTPENRWVAGRARQWHKRLRSLLRVRPRLEPGMEPALRTLELLAEDPRLAELRAGPHPTSHVLQHRRDYRTLARLDRELRRALTREKTGEIPLTLKSLPLLYEYWVLLEVHGSLLELGFVAETGGPPKSADRYQTDLQEQGQILYRAPGGARAQLTYEGLFRRDESQDWEDLKDGGGKQDSVRSFTSTQHPDGLLVLTLEHADWPVCVVIDAKYRLSSSGRGPRVSDVNAMHRYRDALLLHRGLEDEAVGLVYAIAKAWFVYPEDPAGLPLSPPRSLPREKDPKARLWHAALTIGVGAIPALPGKSGLLREALKLAIQSPPAKLERSRPRTVHNPVVTFDPRELCLRAVVPEVARLAVHEDHRLYHVPVDEVEDPSGFSLVMLGVRTKGEGTSRRLDFPAYLYRCTFVATRRRSELPVAYLRNLGPSHLEDEPEYYQLYMLGERINLPGTTSVQTQGLHFRVAPAGELLGEEGGDF